MPLKGCKHTEEAKRKISKARKGKKRETMKGKKNPNWQGGRMQKCKQCNNEFWVTPSDIKMKQRKFCSMKCYGKWKSQYRIGKNNSNWRGGQAKQICKQCGKEFLARAVAVKNGQRKFCSYQCSNKYTAIGKRNPRWKGGVSHTYLKHFAEREWNKIRKRCYKRDGYRCQACGIFNVVLHAHHIIPWRISHDDDLKNLITVCGKCHKKLERKWEKTYV